MSVILSRMNSTNITTTNLQHIPGLRRFTGTTSGVPKELYPHRHRRRRRHRRCVILALFIISPSSCSYDVMTSLQSRINS